MQEMLPHKLFKWTSPRKRKQDPGDRGIKESDSP